MPETELDWDKSQTTWLKRVFAWTSKASIEGSEGTGTSKQEGECANQSTKRTGMERFDSRRLRVREYCMMVDHVSRSHADEYMMQGIGWLREIWSMIC